MKLYSTNDKSNIVNFKEALFNSLPKDKGLYMPSHFPKFNKSFFEMLDKLSFQEISYIISKALLKESIDDESLQNIIERAINFPAPVVELSDDLGILELFHGPSLAFKDFGARFMAQTMSYFNKENDKEITILVATSGDTGGAVAMGFHNTPGINVIILYPSGKVTELQEKQLTTLGGNIKAFEIDGTFDDCQKIVKTAFLDKELNHKYNLSSANSINIARLIPQTFYYFEAYKQIQKKNKRVNFIVPSGNFGNLTAGLFAKRMGLPVNKFIAATNANDIFTKYINTGTFTPRPSVHTLSNAMDVGNPSNFPRILDIYCSTWNIIKNEIESFTTNDSTTLKNIKEIKLKYDYILDPHAAVGYSSYKQIKNNTDYNIILETAHPSKFLATVNKSIKTEIDIPKRLNDLAKKKKESIKIGKYFNEFKKVLLS